MSEKSKQICEKTKDPKACTAEQIKICHGEGAKHACKTEAKAKVKR
jgi:hypothetical protein